jgi:antirestriction protein ArdC
MSNVAYDKVTEAIMERLEAGVIPWRCPWSTMAPQNASGRKYNGINVMLLSMQGYKSPVWLTYKQAQERGGTVRKGQKGTPVVFWKWLERKDEDARPGEISTRGGKIPFLRYYTVFNSEQCDDLDLALPEEPNPDADPIESAEAIVSGYRMKPTIEYGGGSASYSPTLDRVRCPEISAFDSVPEFYDTLFHELTHSTGHADRLARASLTTERARFGSDPYAREELVAEVGAAMLCHHAGLDIPALVDNSAAYIGSWLKRLKNDKRLVVVAAAQAQKASDYILGKTAPDTNQD